MVFRMRPVLSSLAIGRLLRLAGVLAMASAIVVSAAEPVVSSNAAKFDRKALVIGNSRYRALPALKNAVNDAQDVCASLQKLGFETTCLYDIESKREMRNAVREFATSLDFRSAGFFYFAGHGIQVRGENYLIPTNAEIRTPPDVDYEGFELGYVLRSLAEARNAPNIVVLDACRDNPFQRAGATGWESGLARVDPPVGSVLVYATAPNGAAIDGVGRNGLFTRHLLSQMGVQGLTLDEMLRRVAQGVEDEARNRYGDKQIPYRSSSYSAQFCLAGCSNPELDKKIRDISEQKERLAKELEEVSSENARLRREAVGGAKAVRDLELRVEELVRQASTQGSQRKDVEQRLQEARDALTAARASQDERARLEEESRTKSIELSRMQKTLQQQSDQLEAYRAEIQRLTMESNRKRTETRSSTTSPEGSRREQLILPSF